MSAIVLKDFKGLLPRRSQELLPGNIASEAVNVDLRSGNIRPLRGNLFVVTPTKAGTKKTIYLYAENYWFHWIEDVDVVKGPIAGDVAEVTYFTGDGVPKVTDNSIATVGGGTDYPNNSYNMGLPAPLTSPTVDFSGTALLPNGLITLITFYGESGQNGGYYGARIYTTHNLKVGTYVTIYNVVGTTELNGNRYKVVNSIGGSAFDLDTGDVELSSYVSGGVWELSLQDAESTAYVYTFVGFLGGKLIESAPSPPSDVIDIPEYRQVDVTGMETAPSGGGAFGYVQYKRIYRATTGNFGTEYQLVAQIALATTSYTDNVAKADLGDVLQTTGWLPPPDDMKGLIGLPNGIVAGFSKNELCLSVPYQPHTFPAAYRYAVNYDIVGIGHYGTTIVICTKGTPYISRCFDPQTAGPIDTELEQACVSKRSIASLDSGVIYASPDGLVMVNAGGSRIITQSYFTKEEWQALQPATMHGHVHDQRYVGFYNDGLTIGGFVFDPSNPDAGLIHLDFWASAGYRDLLTDDLYLMVGNDIVKFEGDTVSYLTGVWASSRLRTDRLLSFAWAQVRAESFPVTIYVYADANDGTGMSLKHTQAINSSTPFRLPAGFVADQWKVEVQTATGGEASAIYLAETIEDLQRTA